MVKANEDILSRHLSAEVRDALGGWREGTGPAYQRLAAALTAAVQRQELLPGTKLPPERVLAKQLGVARTTVSAAYGLLERKGLVQRRQGRGTHVAGADGAGAAMRAAELTTSLQRNVLFRRLGECPADTIDLLGSFASPSLAIRESLAAAAGAVNFHELVDRGGYLPLGYPPLRRTIAARLTAGGLATAEDEILVTGGAQQALSLLASCYVTPGAVVVAEDPTFPGAIDAFRAAGGRILTVPVRATGADPGLLAATLSQALARLAYLMPTFHNPTGSVMPDADRREIARLSRASQIPVIEDNALAELALGCEPPLPIAAYAREATIISVGSLSKLFWAGLRVGWIRAPRPVIVQLGRVKAVADLGTSLVSQAIAVHLLADADRILGLRRRELADRLSLLHDLLERGIPDWRWRQPQGGLTAWVRLPEGSSSEFAQVARRHGVLVVPGTVMSSTGRFDEYLRLPFDHQPEVLEQGIDRLARAWREYHGALGARGSGALDVIV
ncbi:MAG: PLP-dependent aminotransferase family protein [Streptosporangiaceae bacterium]